MLPGRGLHRGGSEVRGRQRKKMTLNARVSRAARYQGCWRRCVVGWQGRSGRGSCGPRSCPGLPGRTWSCWRVATQVKWLQRVRVDRMPDALVALSRFTHLAPETDQHACPRLAGERPWPLRLLRDPSVSALHPIRSASFHLRRVADTLAQVCVPGSPQGAPQGAASGVESWADVRRKIAECWAALEACCSSDSNSAARGGTAECHDQSKLQADAPADASLDGDLQPNAPLAACWACALGCLAEVLVPQRGLRDSDADAGAGFEKNIPCGPQEWSHAALSAAEALHARQRTPSEDTSGSEGGGHACAAAQPSASSGAPSPPSKGGRGWAARPSRCSLEGALPALLLARDAAAAAGDAGAAQAMGRTVALVASCGATSTVSWRAMARAEVKAAWTQPLLVMLLLPLPLNRSALRLLSTLPLATPVSRRCRAAPPPSSSAPGVSGRSAAPSDMGPL